MEPWKIRPLGARLLLHKCENEEPKDESGEVLIALPDKTRDNTQFCKILAVGPKCKVPWPVEGIVKVKQDFHKDLHAVPGGDNEFWLADETIVEPVVYG